jgi:hypothetical protein
MIHAYLRIHVDPGSSSQTSGIVFPLPQVQCRARGTRRGPGSVTAWAYAHMTVSLVVAIGIFIRLWFWFTLKSWAPGTSLVAPWHDPSISIARVQLVLSTCKFLKYVKSLYSIADGLLRPHHNPS